MPLYTSHIAAWQYKTLTDFLPRQTELRPRPSF